MSMTYDLVGNLKETIDYEDLKTTYTYDALGRELTRTTHCVTDNCGTPVTTDYDEVPRANEKYAIKVTDQRGENTVTGYDGKNRIIRRSNADNEDFTWQYDESGNLTRTEDEEGAVTVNIYDERSFLQRIERTAVGGGQIIATELDYDDNGNRTHTHNWPGGSAPQQTIEVEYDAWNRPNRQIDADLKATDITYDGEGNIIKLKEPDISGEPVAIRRWLRDIRGRVTQYVDAATAAAVAAGEASAACPAVACYTEYDANDNPK
jgi:YD repeat-containing protein